jgi:hypothetical protein
MASARQKHDPWRRVAKLEDEVRRLRLAQFGESGPPTSAGGIGPAARISNTGDIIADDMFPRIAFTGESYDTDGAINAGDGRLYATSDGIWRATVYCLFSAVDVTGFHLYLDLAHRDASGSLSEEAILHGFLVTYSGPSHFIQVGGSVGFNMAAGDYVDVHPAYEVNPTLDPGLPAHNGYMELEKIA